LLCKYQQKERIIRINGEFIPFDPREWNSNYNVTINVGLGTGQRQEQLSTMAMILQKQEQILQQYGLSNPLVNIKQYRDTMAKFIHMAGFKDASEFMNEITPEMNEQLSQPQPDQPDSNTEAAMILAQVEREKAQLKAQTDQAKLALDREQMELEAAKDALELKQKEVQQTADLALKELKIKLDASSKGEKATTDKTKMIMEALEKINNIANQGINK
jgi:hypothetical protein